MSDFITFNDITVRLGNQYVFKNYSEKIKKETVTCIMGPSGSGKTTLLRLIMGLISPKSGTVDGIKGERIAAVFQEDRLCLHLSSVENVALVLRDFFPRDIIKQNLLSLSLTEDDLLKTTSEFSGGMRRRVAVARAIMANRDIVLLDEPFKGLDDITRNATYEYIKKNTAQKTVITVTHDIQDAAMMNAEIIRIV